MNATRGVMDSPLRSVLLIEEITRRKTGKFRSVSPPGHLLHLVLSGRVRQYADGRCQVLSPGSLVWYHQMEAIEGSILAAPWRFITLNFIAPTIPPPEKMRVRPAHAGEAAQIRALLRAWRSSGCVEEVRSLQCFALLSQLLADCLPRFGSRRTPDEAEVLSAGRWWAIEKELRLHLDQTPALPELARRSGMSLRSLVRACIAATGLPPARRVTALRLAQARHLLQVTRLPITEIALQVGYPRVQELSRAMHKHTNQTPREVRAASAPFDKEDARVSGSRE